MSISCAEDVAVGYSTSYRVQAWFLKRSRDTWKAKHQALKADAKRLQNRVNDVTKSREAWCEEAKGQRQRVATVEAENAALRDELAKKNTKLSAANC